jgi:DUF4097 and DUF4098 domain-containing protein YvlB
MKQLVSLSTVLALIAPWGSAQMGSPVTREGAYWVRTIGGSITVGQAERLRLDTIGNVTVKGDAVERAVYKLKVKVKARDAREAELLLGQFEARSRAQGEWQYLTILPPRLNSETPELSLNLPRTLKQVWVETRAGSAQVNDFDGDVQVRSGGGQLGADAIKGRADLWTGGGDIQVGTVAGAVKCFSGAGVIRVQSAGGESQFETAGGEIFVHQVTGPMRASTAGGNIRIEKAGGAVFARTAAGLIQVQQADGVVTAESSGGAIQVNAANGVRCDSAGGAIRLRNVAGSMRASTAFGSILAELLSGNHMQESLLTTNSGDITVFISSNIPLTVAARNESAGAAGRIISDFPEIRVRTPGQPGFSPVVAEGTLNGGGPVLHINVIGGTIYLRRQK